MVLSRAGEEILALFRTLPSQILITTDAAVKDLELPGVPLVVHVPAAQTRYKGQENTPCVLILYRISSAVI